MKWNIDKIESLSEKAAIEMADETMQIKGFQVYFVDFEEFFGYSALVFKDGRSIYYANDYELHHKHRLKTKQQLRAWYIWTLNRKLFTEDEIRGPIKDYDEYRRKDDFLRNYYGMQRENISMFFIGSDEEWAKRKRKTDRMLFDPVSFAYYNDREFVLHHVQLHADLLKSLSEMEEDYEYWKQAFLTEMFNHEYSINWDADFDTLSAFGNLKHSREDDVNSYFDQLEFSNTKRRAYVDARKTYYATCIF